MNSATQGERALAESNAPLAIQHFTSALTELPRAPNYYIRRSTAFSRVKAADGGPNPQSALRDAEIALFLARERGKRELILSAQMRRAISLFQLERYGDAKFILELIETMTADKSVQDRTEGVKAAMSGSAAKKDGYSAELPIWLAKVRRRLRELGEDDEKAAVSAVEYPFGTAVPTEKELKAQLENLKAGKPVDAVVETRQQPAQQSTGVPVLGAEQTKDIASPVAAHVPEKARHEWYQSQDSVVVTIYVKGVPKDKVETELKDESVSLQFPLPSGSEYDFTLDPLYARIDTTASKVTVMGTKIEIVLKKQTPGQKWNSLESFGKATKLADRPAAAAAPAAGPTYPTSSRKGTKDWDKVASSLTQKPAKDEKTKNDGDESDDSEFGGDAVDGFFKKLYAGADPDTRRAMMKSYVESKGTSLSTNWSEVEKKTMEVYPEK